MTGERDGDPIFHLSISVSDRTASRAFYVDLLGGEPRRAIPGQDWFDVWLWGAQVTFHEWPDTVLPERLTRGQHFGATLPRGVWDETRARLEAAGADFAKPASYDSWVGTAKM
jgi:extradiol dioxygenase family protein